MIDKFTFGSSKVAIDLVDMLNTRYSKLDAKKVSRSIQSQFKVINDIYASLHPNFKQLEKMLHMYLQYRKLTKPPHAHIDEALKDRINNIIETKVKCLIDLARANKNDANKPTYEDLEALLYGCMVKWSNEDEEDPYTVYERAYKALNLPDRMEELKTRFMKAEDRV